MFSRVNEGTMYPNDARGESDRGYGMTASRGPEPPYQSGQSRDIRDYNMPSRGMGNVYQDISPSDRNVNLSISGRPNAGSGYEKVYDYNHRGISGDLTSTRSDNINRESQITNMPYRGLDDRGNMQTDRFSDSRVDSTPNTTYRNDSQYMPRDSGSYQRLSPRPFTDNRQQPQSNNHQSSEFNTFSNSRPNFNSNELGIQRDSAITGISGGQYNQRQRDDQFGRTSNDYRDQINRPVYDNNRNDFNSQYGRDRSEFNRERDNDSDRRGMDSNSNRGRDANLDRRSVDPPRSMQSSVQLYDYGHGDNQKRDNDNFNNSRNYPTGGGSGDTTFGRGGSRNDKFDPHDTSYAQDPYDKGGASGNFNRRERSPERVSYDRIPGLGSPESYSRNRNESSTYTQGHTGWPRANDISNRSNFDDDRNRQKMSGDSDAQYIKEEQPTYVRLRASNTTPQDKAVEPMRNRRPLPSERASYEEEWENCRICNVNFTRKDHFLTHCQGLVHTQRVLELEKMGVNIEDEMQRPIKKEEDVPKTKREQVIWLAEKLQLKQGFENYKKGKKDPEETKEADSGRYSKESVYIKCNLCDNRMFQSKASYEMHLSSEEHCKEYLLREALVGIPAFKKKNPAAIFGMKGNQLQGQPRADADEYEERSYRCAVITNFVCRICDTRCNGYHNWKSHVDGKKHLRTVLQTQEQLGGEGALLMKFGSEIPLPKEGFSVLFKQMIEEKIKREEEEKKRLQEEEKKRQAYLKRLEEERKRQEEDRRRKEEQERERKRIEQQKKQQEMRDLEQKLKKAEEEELRRKEQQMAQNRNFPMQLPQQGPPLMQTGFSGNMMQQQGTTWPLANQPLGGMPNQGLQNNVVQYPSQGMNQGLRPSMGFQNNNLGQSGPAVSMFQGNMGMQGNMGGAIGNMGGPGNNMTGGLMGVAGNMMSQNRMMGPGVNMGGNMMNQGGPMGQGGNMAGPTGNMMNQGSQMGPGRNMMGQGSINQGGNMGQGNVSWPNKMMGGHIPGPGGNMGPQGGNIAPTGGNIGVGDGPMVNQQNLRMPPPSFTNNTQGFNQGGRDPPLDQNRGFDRNMDMGITKDNLGGPDRGNFQGGRNTQDDMNRNILDDRRAGDPDFGGRQSRMGRDGDRDRPARNDRDRHFRDDRDRNVSHGRDGPTKSRDEEKVSTAVDKNIRDWKDKNIRAERERNTRDARSNRDGRDRNVREDRDRNARDRNNRDGKTHTDITKGRSQETRPSRDKENKQGSVSGNERKVETYSKSSDKPRSGGDRKADEGRRSDNRDRSKDSKDKAGDRQRENRRGESSRDGRRDERSRNVKMEEKRDQPNKKSSKTDNARDSSRSKTSVDQGRDRGTSVQSGKSNPDNRDKRRDGKTTSADKRDDRGRDRGDLRGKLGERNEKKPRNKSPVSKAGKRDGRRDTHGDKDLRLPDRDERYPEIQVTLSNRGNEQETGPRLVEVGGGGHRPRDDDLRYELQEKRQQSHDQDLRHTLNQKHGDHDRGYNREERGREDYRRNEKRNEGSTRDNDYRARDRDERQDLEMRPHLAGALDQDLRGPAPYVGDTDERRQNTGNIEDQSADIQGALHVFCTTMQAYLVEIQKSQANANVADSEEDELKILRHLTPTDREMVYQIREVTGIRSLNTVMQTLRILASMDPGVIQTVGSLGPGEIQRLCAGDARMAGVSQEMLGQLLGGMGMINQGKGGPAGAGAPHQAQDQGLRGQKRPGPPDQRSSRWDTNPKRGRR